MKLQSYLLKILFRRDNYLKGTVKHFQIDNNKATFPGPLAFILVRSVRVP